MPQHQLSDRYRKHPDKDGWQIRYGPSDGHGECVGHIHDEAHAELICAGVNLILASREQRQHPATEPTASDD